MISKSKRPAIRKQNGPFVPSRLQHGSRPTQSELASITSPPLIVPRARQVCSEIVSL
ncbi:hypothetical protein SAMN05444166_8347 [Singulisphaera sp. GP187]|nr:hypothetical protein SAMN05444166_8347 [Singulisphaera sp. GP187]